MSTPITLIIWYRAVSVLSLFVTLPLPPLSLFRDFSPLRLEVCVLLRTGGSFCVVSALMFALLRAFDLTGAWSQTRNFTWHPSNLRQKMCGAFTSCRFCCFVILVCRFQWCLNFHWRIALAHRVPSYIYRYIAMTQHVSCICLALFLSNLLIDNWKYSSWSAKARFVAYRLAPKT